MWLQQAGSEQCYQAYCVFTVGMDKRIRCPEVGHIQKMGSLMKFCEGSTGQSMTVGIQGQLLIRALAKIVVFPTQEELECKTEMILAQSTRRIFTTMPGKVIVIRSQD